MTGHDSSPDASGRSAKPAGVEAGLSFQSRDGRPASASRPTAPEGVVPQTLKAKTETVPRHFGLHGTRLLRLLADLAVVDGAGPHPNLSEGLGRLIDFGDSLRLSLVLDRLPLIEVEPAGTGGASIQDPLLRVRRALVEAVLDSFAPAARGTRLALPRLERGVPLEELVTFEPYQRFYAAHQRAMEARIQTLQLQVRQEVAALSVELAQLAALDEAVRDSLAMPTRRSLAVIPRLLGQRFEDLRRSQEPGSGAVAVDPPDAEMFAIWSGPSGWLGRFLRDMRGLLLAEVDLRLLPVLGLVEAVNEQVTN